MSQSKQAEKAKAKKEPTTPPEDSKEFTDLIDGAGLKDEEIAVLRELLSVPPANESLMESGAPGELLKKLLALAETKNMDEGQKDSIKSAFQKLKDKVKYNNYKLSMTKLFQKKIPNQQLHNRKKEILEIPTQKRLKLP